MKAALLNGFMGFWLTLLISRGSLQLELSDALLSLFASNFAGLVALVLTLRIERRLERFKIWLNRSFVTWSVLITLYFSILLACAPVLREGKVLLSLLLPLILSTGFSLIVFGPIQDFLVRREQRNQLGTS